MKWSWRMGRVAGIDIHVHATFPLLFAWITVVMLRSGATASAIAGTLVLILAVFALIVIHETAHALTARRYGITTHDITLLPIGGIAHLDHMPREPKQELLIAVAGPAVNVVFAIVLFGILALTGGLSELRVLAATNSTQITTSRILAELFGINLSLTVFNLLPAFPLDGGRVMRALLAIKRKDYVSATLAAAKVGKAFALIFGVVGLFVLDNPMLVVIALFVWLSAASEASAAQTSAALADVPLSQLLITDMRTLSPSDRLSSAVKLTVHGFQQDFPVVADGRLVGMLGRADLVRGLSQHGANAMVQTAMRKTFPFTMPDAKPEETLKLLTTRGAGAVPVVSDDKLLGLLTLENVAEFMLLQKAGKITDGSDDPTRSTPTQFPALAGRS